MSVVSNTMLQHNHEFCHNIPAFPQPVPHKNKGGDCFACALKAFTDWAFDNPPDFETVWDCFLHRPETGTPFLSNAWPSYKAAFQRLSDLGWKMDFGAGIPVVEYSPERDQHAWRHHHTIYPAYGHKIEAMLKSGWVVYTSIILNPSGFWGGGKYKAGDHVVLIDGVRKKNYTWEVHIVCSAKGGREYWETVENLVNLHGIGSMWFVRKQH